MKKKVPKNMILFVFFLIFQADKEKRSQLSPL